MLKKMVLTSKSVKWTNDVCWCLLFVISLNLIGQVISLTGPNICMVQQKYNITKRIKYKVPITVRTYEWCFAVPLPRCTKWKTEMKELTRLETEERTAEVADCCPGFKVKDVYCIPICPPGRTGPNCSDECPKNKWGPNCSKNCRDCSVNGYCSPYNGRCQCDRGWEGESCRIKIPKSSTTKAIIKTTKQASNEDTTTVPLMQTTQDYVTDFSIKYEDYTSNYGITDISDHESVGEEVSNGTVDLTTAYTTRDENDTEKTIESLTSKSTVINQTTSLKPFSFYTETTPFTIKTSLVNNKLNITVNYQNSSETQATEKTKSPFKDIPQPETTSITRPTTTRFRPKEIWIKPAQKGETTIPVKIKYDHIEMKTQSGTKKQSTLEPTSRTIMVSIIPTLPHIIYKKISMTTHINNKKTINYVKSSTGSSLESTTTPVVFVQPITPTSSHHNLFASKLYSAPADSYSLTKPKSELTATAKSANFQSNSTINSMSSTTNEPELELSTAKTTTAPLISYTNEIETSTFGDKPSSIKFSTNPSISQNMISERQSYTDSTKPIEISSTNTVTDVPIVNSTELNYELTASTLIINSVNTNTVGLLETTTEVVNLTTVSIDDENFNILTEPEHITSLAEDGSRGNGTMDIKSILTIIGGVMMVIITLAVIIVMMERYIKSKYEDIVKKNDIRFEMNNGNDSPPFVRNIYNTPLPDPPKIENNHYQPISTLDRSLKQFMRPVVVQKISPIMLENFRDILECHYDHLPPRNYDDDEEKFRIDLPAPSVSECTKLLSRTHSLTEFTIDSMKCEAELNTIDPTTSEPLYAEIPCWRPHSEYAVEVLNVNGEAVTEL